MFFLVIKKLKLRSVNDELKEHTLSSEKTIGEIKKQLRDSEMKKEEALSKLTELSIRVQSLKANVFMLKLQSLNNPLE